MLHVPADNTCFTGAADPLRTGAGNVDAGVVEGIKDRYIRPHGDALACAVTHHVKR